MDRKPAVATITAVVLAVAGCGGSGTLSQADLAKQVNAICKRRSADALALVARTHDVRLATQRMVPVATRAIAELSALKPPASLRARYVRFVAYERAFLTSGKRVAAGQRFKRPEIGHPRERLIRELGFSGCR